MKNIKKIGRIIITEENISIEDFTYENGTMEELKKDALGYAKLRIEAELSLITKQSTLTSNPADKTGSVAGK